MPNEAGTDTTRSDAPSVDDDLFGDAPEADDKPEAPVEGEDSDAGNAREQQANGDAGEQEADDKADQDGQGSGDAAAQAEAPQEEQDSGDAGEPADADASTEDDLKVVLSIKGGRAVIGVQKPSADPHIETFDDPDLSGLAQELVSVTERRGQSGRRRPSIPPTSGPLPRPEGATGVSRARPKTHRRRRRRLRGNSRHSRCSRQRKLHTQGEDTPPRCPPPARPNMRPIFASHAYMWLFFVFQQQGREDNQ